MNSSMSTSQKFLRISIIGSLLSVFLLPFSAQATVADGSVACAGGGSFTIASNILTSVDNNNCRGVITIPEGVTSIANDAFASHGESITSVIIPDSVVTIGSYSFANTSLLTNVTFGSGSLLTTLGDCAFFFASSLLTIEIPSHVTSIGFATFYQAASLTSISIPSTVTSIGSSAFQEARSLRSISLPRSVTTIGNYAFKNTASLESFTFASESALISIGNEAFNNSTSLTSITIPSHVNSIGSNAFNNNTALTSINVEGDNLTYSSDSGILFNKSKTRLIASPNRRNSSSYTVPDGVETIDSQAFAHSQFLTSITIPNTVTSLGDFTFYQATSLETVTFASNSGIVSIGNSVFLEAASLKSINLPSSVESIGYQAFRGTSSLRSIALPYGLISIGGYAFFESNSLTSINIPFGVTLIDEEAFTGTTYLNSYTYCGVTEFNLVATGLSGKTKTTPCPTAPTFSLSSASETATARSAISGYAITSTGGTIDSYSISPAISNTSGLSFSSTTGQISGIPTTTATAKIYTITAINSSGTGTETFTITVITPPVVYVPPTPVPYLKSLTSPKLTLKDGKLICSSSSYTSGFTLSGVVQTGLITAFTPISLTYNLLINGTPQISLEVKTVDNTATWNSPQGNHGSIATCSVTVANNLVTITELSTSNTANSPEVSSVSQSLIDNAIGLRTSSLAANSKSYEAVVTESRAIWKSSFAVSRATYYEERNRMKSLSNARLIRSMSSSALKTYIAARKKNDADYKAKEISAAEIRDSADKKANNALRELIESIGYGVLIP